MAFSAPFFIAYPFSPLVRLDVVVEWHVPEFEVLKTTSILTSALDLSLLWPSAFALLAIDLINEAPKNTSRLDFVFGYDFTQTFDTSNPGEEAMPKSRSPLSPKSTTDSAEQGAPTSTRHSFASHRSARPQSQFSILQESYDCSLQLRASKYRSIMNYPLHSDI